MAAALGYQSPQEAIRTHVDDEDKGVTKCYTPGGKRPVPSINESGLHRLALLPPLPRRTAGQESYDIPSPLVRVREVKQTETFAKKRRMQGA